MIIFKKCGSGCMARKERGHKRSILQVCEHWAAAFDAARQPEARFTQEVLNA